MGLIVLGMMVGEVLLDRVWKVIVEVASVVVVERY